MAPSRSRHFCGTSVFGQKPWRDLMLTFLFCEHKEPSDVGFFSPTSLGFAFLFSGELKIGKGVLFAKDSPN